MNAGRGERVLRAARLLKAADDHVNGPLTVEELARLIVLEQHEAGDVAPVLLGLVEVGAVLLDLCAEAHHLTVDELVEMVRAVACDEVHS